MNPKRRRALTCSGLALAVAGATVIAQAFTALPALAAPSGAQRPAANAGWRVSASISVKGQVTVITNIAADSRGDAWATGIAAGGDDSSRAVIEHWTGGAWRRVPLPARLLPGVGQRNNWLGPVGANAPNDVWIFSLKGQYLRLNGKKWTRGPLPRQAVGYLFPQSVKVFGPADVWVLGCRIRSSTASQSSCPPYAAKFNGRRWQLFRLPGQGDVGEVSAPSADDIWTIVDAGQYGVPGPSGRSRIVHWNGTSWRVMPVQPKLPAKARLSAISASTGSDIWVGGAAPASKHGAPELIWHWNGRAWADASPAVQGTRYQPFVEDLVPDGTGGIWELALTGGYDEQSRIRHFSGGRWVASTSVRWLLTQLAAVPGSVSTWGVGISGNFSRGLIVLHGPTPR